LERALAKAHVRVLGIDDGPFDRRAKRAPLAGVVVQSPSFVETVARSSVRVDGTDATERIIRLVEESGHWDGLRAILLDGIVVGGFNIIDLDAVHAALGLPVVAVTPHPPDFAKMRAAIRQWFPDDAARRWKLVRAHRLFPVRTGGAPILATAVGCRRLDATRLVRRTTVVGHWPEPLRLAHLVARALAAEGAVRTNA
jgi:uncharacterized protein